MLKIAALKLAGIEGDHTFSCVRGIRAFGNGKRQSPEHVKRRQIAQIQSGWRTDCTEKATMEGLDPCHCRSGWLPIGCLCDA